MTVPTSPLAILSLACAGIAGVLLIAYLVFRPPLVRLTKIWLLCALGIFPIGAAMSGNVQGYERTKARGFCASCHVMIPQTSDSDDPMSHSLSSRHARNRLFGAENCYTCHEDYGMFGTIMTKVGGMKHVWLYYTQYRNTPIAVANETIHLYEPYPNDSCMQCHSTRDELWLAVRDHASALEDVRADRISCASGGCHGFAHPNTKSAAALSIVAQTVRSDAGLATLAPRDGGFQ